MEQSSFSAGMGGVWDLGNLCRTRNLERELLFRWDGWCMGFREFMSDAEFGAGAPFPLDLISLWVE